MPKKSSIQNQKKRKGKVGRPRIYDGDLIAKELLEWVEKEDSINLCAFCADKKYLPLLLWRLEKDNQAFSDAYMLAKMRLAERRERYTNDNSLNYGSFQRYQSVYDPFLRKDEDNEKEKDAARKQGISDKEQVNLFMLAKLAAEGKISQKE